MGLSEDVHALFPIAAHEHAPYVVPAGQLTMVAVVLVVVVVVVIEDGDVIVVVVVLIVVVVTEIT